MTSPWGDTENRRASPDGKDVRVYRFKSGAVAGPDGTGIKPPVPLEPPLTAGEIMHVRDAEFGGAYVVNAGKSAP